jgi:hypothetical protein
VVTLFEQMTNSPISIEQVTGSHLLNFQKYPTQFSECSPADFGSAGESSVQIANPNSIVRLRFINFPFLRPK